MWWIRADRKKTSLLLFLVIVAFVTFGRTFSNLPVTTFAEIMGYPVIVEAGQNDAFGWAICSMTKDAVVFFEAL